MADYKCPDNKYTEWLIMVYLAGDNNLSPQSIGYLQELEDATHNENVRVVAGFDPSMPLPRGARYLEIKRHLATAHPYEDMDWPLHNDLLAPGHVVVMPDFCKTKRQPVYPSEPVAKEAFARFLDWVSTCYEAKKYMLILFGHGPLVAGNTFLSDSTPPSYLKLKDLAKILKDHFCHKKINILGCDNCVMNGIETAVQLHDKVDYMIGSQGLMLINGWPFRKIIQEVGDNYQRDPKFIAERVLRVCAKNLLDFTLMERSSEQAICDVNKFCPTSNIVKAVKQLSVKLQEGLSVYDAGPQKGELLYPLVRDVVRQARIEAQAYWAETFVDLYDFCELLLLRCNDALCNLQTLIQKVFISSLPPDKYQPAEIKKELLTWPPIQRLQDVATACQGILKIFQTENVVIRSYYVCPQLQYSHGVSIYFPWTLPEGPLTFEPNGSQTPLIKTPFDEYGKYDFNKYSDWANTLEAFFKATLRNVRRVEYEYTEDDVLFFNRSVISRDEHVERKTPAIDLLKSGQSSGEDDEFDFLRVKNYPRRFYLSPADCARMLPVYGPGGNATATREKVMANPGGVSYLGWNIRGFMAEVIGLEPGEAFHDQDPTCPELKRSLD
jgi:cysteine peptidase C11 family protein